MHNSGIVWRSFTAAVVIAFTVVAFLWMVTPAPAAASCGPYDKLVEYLGEKYGEMFRDRHENGAIIELFTSKKGTWTIIRRESNGWSCMVETGVKKMPKPLAGA